MYDVIIFVVLALLFVAAWFVCPWLCRKARCCGCEARWQTYQCSTSTPSFSWRRYIDVILCGGADCRAASGNAIAAELNSKELNSAMRDSRTTDEDRWQPTDVSSTMRWLSVILRVCLAIALSYLCTVLIIVIIGSTAADSFSFEPVKASSCPGFPCPLDDSGVYCCDYTRFENELNTSTVQFGPDGSYHGWLMSNLTGTGPILNLLYSHGSGWNIAVGYRIARYKYLLSLGRVNLFVYDYPGYGRSAGTPTESSVKNSAKLAFEKFSSLLNLSDGTITLLGRSMGGGVAVWLSSVLPVKAMILQSTFNSFADAAADTFPLVRWVVRRTWGVRFDSGVAIRTFDKCLYESHSVKDEWVPYSDARKLFMAASRVPASCKRWVATDTHHDDPMTSNEKQELGLWVQNNLRW